MDERNEGKLILQAIPILRHMEIRSLNSPFYFDGSALETLTERSSAENAIDCLVLSTAATSFSIESVRNFLEVHFFTLPLSFLDDGIPPPKLSLFLADELLAPKKDF